MTLFKWQISKWQHLSANERHDRTQAKFFWCTPQQCMCHPIMNQIIRQCPDRQSSIGHQSHKPLCDSGHPAHRNHELYLAHGHRVYPLELAANYIPQRRSKRTEPWCVLFRVYVCVSVCVCVLPFVSARTRAFDSRVAHSGAASIALKLTQWYFCAIVQVILFAPAAVVSIAMTDTNTHRKRIA